MAEALQVGGWDLEGCVRGVIGEVEEEGFGGFGAVDEGGGFAGEGVGEVAGEGFGAAVAFDGDEVFAGGAVELGAEVVVAAAEEAVHFAETAPERVHGGGGAEVPFADEAGAVTGGAEGFGEGDLVEGKAGDWVRGVEAWVVFVAEALLVPAGEEAGAGRTAEGVGDVGGGADDAGGGKGVEVRGGNVGGAGEAEIGRAEVIDEDDDDVGP